MNKEKHSKKKDSKKHKKGERLKDIDNAENVVQFKERSKNQHKYANGNSEELLDVKNGKTKVKRKRKEEDRSFGMYLNFMRFMHFIVNDVSVTSPLISLFTLASSFTSFMETIWVVLNFLACHQAMGNPCMKVDLEPCWCNRHASIFFCYCSSKKRSYY